MFLRSEKDLSGVKITRLTLSLAFPLKTTGERDKKCKKYKLLPLPPVTCCHCLPVLWVHLDCAFSHDPLCHAESSTLRPDLPRLSQVPHSRPDQLQEQNSVSCEAVQVTMCNHLVTWKLNVYVEQKHFRGKKIGFLCLTCGMGEMHLDFLSVFLKENTNRRPPSHPLKKFFDTLVSIWSFAS